MDSQEGELDRIIGLEVYARIHENIGNDIELVKDPENGYLYKGVIAGKAIFENGHIEEHHVMKLSKPILLHKNNLQIMHVLVTPRYKGNEMKALLEGQELTASFSHFRDMTIPEPSLSNVWRFKARKFGTKEFVWIGIGELSARKPDRPYSEAPWDMVE